MEVTLAIRNQEYSIENNINTRLCSETNSPPKLNILLLAIFEYRSYAVQRCWKRALLYHTCLFRTSFL